MFLNFGHNFAQTHFCPMTWIEKMNSLGASHTPFLFIIDFDMKKPVILPLNEMEDDRVLYKVGNWQNYTNGYDTDNAIDTRIIKKCPVDYPHYLESFQFVVKNQGLGYSYLLNLTFPTKVTINASLKEVFFQCRARYKLYYRDIFVVFSPEIFVQLENGVITSYPMKGTIDANLPGAEDRLRQDEKEKAEHATIVDLIRNDLSTVATQVRVENYRYMEKIKTNQKDLLQVSSKISGILPDHYLNQLGTILNKLLPAGSICGAPKIKTVELIKQAENYDRDYYTGIFGIFDGKKVDSGVMIRFIENIGGCYYYKSGGGITTKSNPEDEYNELIDKVYVPIG